jgi:hypothetical protein
MKSKYNQYLQKQKMLNFGKKKNTGPLKELITKTKTETLTKNFIRKIKQSKVHN